MPKDFTYHDVAEAMRRRFKDWRHTFVTPEPYPDGSVFAGAWKFNDHADKENRYYIRKAFSYKSLLQLVEADD